MQRSRFIFQLYFYKASSWGRGSCLFQKCSSVYKSDSFHTSSSNYLCESKTHWSTPCSSCGKQQKVRHCFSTELFIGLKSSIFCLIKVLLLANPIVQQRASLCPGIRMHLLACSHNFYLAFSQTVIVLFNFKNVKIKPLGTVSLCFYKAGLKGDTVTTNWHNAFLKFLLCVSSVRSMHTSLQKMHLFRGYHTRDCTHSWMRLQHETKHSENQFG